jgi:toxin ParE1/3/4
MSLLCIFHAKARSDLREIGDYIAEDNPVRAVSFVEELEARCQKIALYPNSGMPRPQWGERIHTAIHGKYQILYSKRNDAVVIERIVHSARQFI